MILISLFVGICVAIIVLAISRQIWAKKQSKQKSINGVSGIKQLIELIKLTQQHRGMHSGFINGQSEFKSKLDSLESNIQYRYKALLKFEAEQKYPDSLSSHYQFKQWQRLIQANNITSSESFQLHSGLIARQLDALWDMSDEFALTSNHDEEIRSSAQRFVKTLPELAEAFGQVRALSVQIASTQTISSDKKLQLVFTLGKIEKHLHALRSSLAKKDYEHLNQYVQKVTLSIKEQNINKQNPDTLFKEATQIIDEVFSFIHSGFEQLKQKVSAL
ncbi:nitrate- and nitrite sensing domain-containing protein [Marinomonas transparens]|uniref:Nitrate/nitrite sensing protein domain-containing protein n=1 Tax=Marinomonas transparens TaxID=2795388 RepID=A0A934N291_9GAMM|nr:nitrate- and nitrite sensing domain-containing protein [Marinomonas transparens]MBJ7538522.1 hypothetical protein [Marinomonas transparens]